MPNEFQYTGKAWPGWNSFVDVEQLSVELFQGNSSSSFPTFGWRDTANVDCFGSSPYPSCSYPDNNSSYGVHNGKVYTTTEGGYWWMRLYYNYYDRSGGWLGTRSHEVKSGFEYDRGTWLPDITVASEIVNLPPVVTQLEPASDAVVNRVGAPDHAVTLSIRANDPDGHNWTGEVELFDPDGTRIARETFAGLRHRSSTTVSTPPVVLPQDNGRYRWCAQARDTSGVTNSTSSLECRYFDYTWNSAPTTPALHAPTSGATLPEGTPLTFAIQASDPELDPYDGLVEIQPCGFPTDVRPVSTSTSASHGLSVGTLAGLEPGCYEWRALAVDQHGWDSGFSGYRTFTVVATATNTPPAVPTQVSPLHGATFFDGQTQTFTVTTTDVDLDEWIGLIEVRSGGVVVAEFATDRRTSGQSASARPPVPLPAGSYTWTARAVDVRGGVSGTSGPRSFTVAGTDNGTPGTPTQLSPASGTTWRASDPQLFTIRATDPDGDAYTGLITVTDTDTGVTRTFETAPAASGQNSAGAPLPPLPAGDYEWTARAVDGEGATSGPSTSRSLTVTGNRTPSTPIHVAPQAGHRFGPTGPQQFAVRASDPDGDAYRAQIQVRDGTTVVAEFTTGVVPSGMDAHGTPVGPIPPGDYTWRARAIDVPGATSGWSSDRTVSVDGPSGFPSDGCDDGDAVADGFAGPTYVKLRADQPDPSSVAVCLRVDGPTVANGGQVLIGLPSTASPPTPTVDGDWSACSTASGDIDPLPDPLLDGEVGDPSDPTTYVTQHLDVYITAGQVWVCSRVTSTAGIHARRVVIPIPAGVETPNVVFLPDAPGPHSPTPDVWPSDPSQACSAGVGGTKASHLNADIGASNVWLASWQPSATKVHLCVRTQGVPQSIGGVLTLDASASPGVSPVVTTHSSDMSACTLQVLNVNDPAELTVRRSTTGANPASLCLNVEGTWLRVTAGTAGDASPPTVTWQPDPGTPG